MEINVQSFYLVLLRNVGGKYSSISKILSFRIPWFPMAGKYLEKKKIFFCGGVENREEKGEKYYFIFDGLVWRYMVQETQRPVVDVAHTGPPGLDVQGLRQTWCWASTALFCGASHDRADLHGGSMSPFNEINIYARPQLTFVSTDHPALSADYHK